MGYFPPCSFSGRPLRGFFPTRGPHGRGRRIKGDGHHGRMAGVNTMGGIFGSLFVGFVALPAFGMETSLLLRPA